MTADTITLTLTRKQADALQEILGEFGGAPYEASPHPDEHEAIADCLRAALEDGGEDAVLDHFAYPPEPGANRSYTIPVELKRFGRGKPIEDRSHELEIDDGMDDDEPDRIDIAAEQASFGNTAALATVTGTQYLRALDELARTREERDELAASLRSTGAACDAARRALEDMAVEYVAGLRQYMDAERDDADFVEWARLAMEIATAPFEHNPAARARVLARMEGE
jgi:hypothetical protein